MIELWPAIYFSMGGPRVVEPLTISHLSGILAKLCTTGRGLRVIGLLFITVFLRSLLAPHGANLNGFHTHVHVCDV